MTDAKTGLYCDLDPRHFPGFYGILSEMELHNYQICVSQLQMELTVRYTELFLIEADRLLQIVKEGMVWELVFHLFPKDCTNVTPPPDYATFKSSDCQSSILIYDWHTLECYTKSEAFLMHLWNYLEQMHPRLLEFTTEEEPGGREEFQV